MTGRVVTAIGLMSGTSMDGVDAAVIRTDGLDIVEPGPSLTVPYERDFRERLAACLGRDVPMPRIEAELTRIHADAVARLLADAGLSASAVRVVGFHGHTVLHAPERRLTRQIGDAAVLAERVGIDVVGEIRQADVAAGGQGAPLAPVYHRARSAGLPRPLAVLNLGGVGNVTYVDEAVGTGEEASLLAWDTGPGNALLDDWVNMRTGRPFDDGGSLAAQGTVSEPVLRVLMDHPYFDTSPPKSLDRNAFDLGPVMPLSDTDGAATLVAFTVSSVVRAVQSMPRPPVVWLVTGGGRHNRTIMSMLHVRLGVDVKPVEAVGWNGDALEAEAFGYVAVRCLSGAPITFPGTTGAPRPLAGGRIFSPK